ncbi:MAG TPA: orotate phosphoribosyltransferase [Hyphomicrobiales bacterium]|nr:orotate phosphoribosyltransferase [Hyphomicrobiales bacterium]
MPTSAARTPSSAIGLGADDRARLFEIIRRSSFGRAKVVLASGRESDFYFDMKPSMFDPEGAALIADGILDAALGAGAAYVGGLEMGAVPVTAAVSAKSHAIGRPVAGLFVRKQAKDHGAKKLIEGLKPGASLKGARVVVVEDVTTTGDSAMKAVDAFRAAGAEIAAVVTIVDREEGAVENFAARGLPFAALFKASEFLNWRG